MKKVFWLSCIALMTLFAFSLPTWAASDAEQVGNALLAEEKSAPDRIPEYWLGIQLRLDDKDIVVQEVVPDSPAAKAGFAKNDIIDKVDDKKITNVFAVLRAVEAAKGKEIKLEIIRDGQPKTIAVTPAKRPEEYRVPAAAQDSDMDAFRKWVEHMQAGGGLGQNGPMQFRFFRPGVILPHGSPIHPPLPGNMSITISKTGDKPANIVVTMGDEKWEVTEKDLDKLPEKVRPYVDHMLGAGAGSVRWMPEVDGPQPTPQQSFNPGQAGPYGSVPGVPGPTPGYQPGPGPNYGPPWGNVERRIEKRMEEMKQRMEKLENELHQRHPDAKTPDQPQAEKNKEETPGKTAL
jgi:membrane-associated protease RseP (regulator of RpoE activity)